MVEVYVDLAYHKAVDSQLEKLWMDENPNVPIPQPVRQVIYFQASDLLASTTSRIIEELRRPQASQ